MLILLVDDRNNATFKDLSKALKDVTTQEFFDEQKHLQFP